MIADQSYGDLLLTEARRALDEQRDQVKYIRSQGLVISTASLLSANFFFRFSMYSGSINPQGGAHVLLLPQDYLAIGFLLASLSAGLFVLLPIYKWQFYIDPNEIIERIESKDDFTSSEVRKIVAMRLGAFIAKNESRLKVLHRMMVVAIFGVACEVICFLI